MTPEETIEMLKGIQNEMIDYAELVGAPAFAYGCKYVYPEPEDYAIEEAIEALKEVQQYRAIGTVEEIKTVKKYIELKKRCGTPSNTIDLCAEYAAIGTVEECREAVDKQKPKRCIIDSCPDHTHYKCPSCGKIQLSTYIYAHGLHRLGRITKYCENCGQALIDNNLEEI